MGNWHKTIQPKSDQLNADDLVGRELLITITKATVVENAEQPAIINYEGDNGKPFKPCKTMRKLIAHCWGGNEADFTGRSMLLYRDESVKWAGEEVGGIRIKAMSHINERKRVMLQANKKSKLAYTVDVLKDVPQAKVAIAIDVEALLRSAELAAANGTESYKAYFQKLFADERKALQHKHEELKSMAAANDADSFTVDESLPM
jgi:hypothetical protein